MIILSPNSMNIISLRFIFILSIAMAVMALYSRTPRTPIIALLLINLWGAYMLQTSIFSMFDQCTLDGQLVSGQNHINLGSYLN